MASTRWTWVGVSSRSWWWTGKPGVLQFMESQRVGHRWATGLNWTDSWGTDLVWVLYLDTMLLKWVFSSGFINHYKFLPLCYLNKNLFKTYFCTCNIFSKVVVQSLSRVRLFVTPWTAAHQASLSFTVSQSLIKLMSHESVMPFLLLLPSIFPSIRLFQWVSSLHQVAKVLEL